MNTIKQSVFLFLLFHVTTAFAEAVEFKVIALFKNAAMIEANGKQKMLRKGQSYKKDIKLLSADSHGAIFLINGKKEALGLHQSKIGREILVESKNLEKKFIRIPRDNSGMYRTSGLINGIPVKFLVDTGASQVAMNETTARRVGLQYKLYGEKIRVSTASGFSLAWAIPVKKISVGGIELKQIDALVVKGAGPEEVLLGMSFLRRLKMQDDGNLLKLTKKL